MPIPTSESIDATWLTEQLQQAGFDVVVVDYQAQEIGTGQIGKCVRYELSLDRTDSGAPNSLVGKFPSDNPVSRGAGVALRNYFREVRFYQTLADKLPIKKPICYYADITDEGPEFALLLQDMSPAIQGDQLKGCNAATAEAAIHELVGLQTPFWCDPSINDYAWLVDSADGSLGSVVGFYQQMLPGFIDRYGVHLSDDQIKIISQIADSPNCPLFSKAGDLFCLEHVDYRLDNMLIDSVGDNMEVTIVDWQSVRVGKPLNDVAYFLGAGLQSELRREVEEGLLRNYHRQLCECGISDFGWEQCWLEYRKSTFAGFAVTVIASMFVEQTQRGDQMFIVMADRHSRHALDLDAAEFLS